MGKFLDLTGFKFGKLTPIKKTKIHNGNAIWLCRCECGNYINAKCKDLNYGSPRSCGCETSRNRYELIFPPNDDCYILVHLSQGVKAKIDWEDWFDNKMCDIKWATDKRYNRWYMVSNDTTDRKKRKAHRLIGMYMGIDISQTIDHIIHFNSDEKLIDNRRCNLRSASYGENMMNKRKQKKCTSRFKGVFFRKDTNKWTSYINFNKRRYYLGCFDNEVDAALEYNKKAKDLFGEYALLNII